MRNTRLSNEETDNDLAKVEGEITVILLECHSVNTWLHINKDLSSCGHKNCLRGANYTLLRIFISLQFQPFHLNFRSNIAEKHCIFIQLF